MSLQYLTAKRRNLNPDNETYPPPSSRTIDSGIPGAPGGGRRAPIRAPRAPPARGTRPAWVPLAPPSRSLTSGTPGTHPPPPRRRKAKSAAPWRREEPAPHADEPTSEERNRPRPRRPRPLPPASRLAGPGTAAEAPGARFHLAAGSGREKASVS